MVFLLGTGSRDAMIHNDHLGTPQKMTDASGTVVWAADYKPFGEATITVSTITNNLRFPGQYFDQETGLNYNINRDYNPTIGRYIEADPVGLLDGINHLYVYSQNNPVIIIDPSGWLNFKPGVPQGTRDISELNLLIALLSCVEKCFGSTLTITATTNGHTGGPHVRGEAADIRYDMPNPSKVLCCAKKCGFNFGLDEKLHPSDHSTGPHIHIQLGNGTSGGHGDLPPNTNECDGCKK